MGRPRTTEPRDRQLNLGLTAAEYESVVRRAAALGTRPVHFGCAVLLGRSGGAMNKQEPADNTSRLLHAQLVRLGNNLNQMVRHLQHATTLKVLARLFRGKMLAMLVHAHDAGELKFFNTHAGLADKRTFKRFIAPLRRIKWVVYCKAPFAGPEQVLRYLSRYTHRVAISNRRLVAADDDAIAFRWKDYRVNGPGRWKTMRLHPHEFVRRFLLHVLPKGFHRIRHYGLFASTNRAESIATARALLNVAPLAAGPQKQPDVAPDSPRVLPCPCPRCGARMIVIEVFARGCEPSWRPTPIRIDTS
jgi:hypothetical protein